VIFIAFIAGTPPLETLLVRKTPSFGPFHVKMIILPRQARDKHKKN
jgi:hypothetical protein